MVAGHLQEKKGHWYLVLNMKNEEGERNAKWIKTGLPVKGNKGKAEQLLIQERQKWSAILEKQNHFNDSQTTETPGDILFTEWLKKWLRIVKNRVSLSTYAGYKLNVEKKILPYFEPRKLTLRQLTSEDLEDFYDYMMDEMGLSANTIIHYHANIHSALKLALTRRRVDTNVAELASKPKKGNFTGSFYTVEEINQLLAAVHHRKIEFAVFMAAFYGLRRSEIIGLKWSAVNFDRKCIEIRHTVTECFLDGKHFTIAEDRTKNKASLRSMPLLPPLIAMLETMKRQQTENRKLFGRSYSMQDSDYIYVDEFGNRVKPNFISQHFNLTLKELGFRHIRFHDLRHSCASMLLAAHVDMKAIQEWLGHGHFSTTANFYAHLESESKLRSAETLMRELNLPVEIGGTELKEKARFSV